jgi:hypothetical protein
MDAIDQEINSAPKCRCDCHFHPGSYRTDPCSICGHNDHEGQILGGIVYGVWVGHRYGLTDLEEAEILNKK